MLDKVSPYQSNPSDSSNRTERSRPSNLPRDDSFRKSMNDRRPKKDQDDVEGAKEEHEDSSSSVFDLSRAKPKPKTPTSSSKSSLKDSSDSEMGAANRPLTAKQGQEQNQDQDLFPPQGEETAAGDEMGSEMQTEEPAPAPGEPKKMEQPQTQPKTPSPKLAQPDQSPELPKTLLQDGAALRAVAGKKPQGDEPSFETSQAGSSSKKQKTSTKDEAASAAGNAAEKGDMAGAMNAGIQGVNLQSEKAPDVEEPIRSSNLKDIAAQIVDRIQVMQKGDETQTTITLKHPPVLAGATITLTANNHAKSEFNISFGNLSPEAKLLIDRKLREDPLTDTLNEKGIKVHMLTTSTQPIENVINTESSEQSSRDRQDQRQQQQDQQDQKKKREIPQNPDEEDR